MSAVTIPANATEALGMLESAMGFLADLDAAQLPAEAISECLRGLERSDAVGAAARGRLLAGFDAKGGPLGDGQRTSRTWLVHTTRVTRGQAAEHKAVQALAQGHAPLLAGLRVQAVTKSVALQLAKWTCGIPDEYRAQAEEIAVAAARAGAGLRELAAICAEIRYRTAPPDPDDQDDRRLDRALFLDTTIDGAGVIRGDLTPQCAAMVQAVLDALSAPGGGGDLRTRAQRYHDALEEAMRRLLASDLLPQRAGQPVKALAHISFTDLCELDAGSALQAKWIEGYRAAWAAHRAAASVAAGDGGAWLDGDAARTVACDAIVIPVVTGDLDPGAVDQLIGLCVQYDRIRGHAGATEAGGTEEAGSADGTGGGAGGGPDGAGRSDGAGSTGTQDGTGTQGGTGAPDGTDVGGTGAGGSAGEVLAMLEQQILAAVIAVVSGPGGVASFLRTNLLGKGLNGPSLPLDVGQSDQIPAHLRRLVALRDQGCQYPGGCDQPAAGCEPHHVVHRADGGRTSLGNLKGYCWWHHHVVLHEMGWALTVRPDGTSQVTSPAGKIIRSHSPPLLD
jgi:Domain of unknown function (DUF222)